MNKSFIKEFTSFWPSKEEWLNLLETNSEIPRWFIHNFQHLVMISRSHDHKEDFIKFCDVYTEYTRNILNTGHWSSVSNSWRRVYSSLRYLLVYVNVKNFQENENLEFYMDQLKLIDDGLILGCSIFNNIGSKIARIIQQKCDTFLVNEDQDDHLETNNLFNDPCSVNVTIPLEIKRYYLEKFNTPSVSCFLELIKDDKPFIITNASNHWPAREKWNLLYWKKIAGFRTVPIEIGSSYAKEDWSQKLLTINAFIEDYILRPNKSIGYLAQHQLFLQIPELEDDIDIPEYCFINNLTSTVDSNIWFGPKGTVSPLHHDSGKLNLLCQIKGYKYVQLFTQSQTEYLYPHSEKMLHNTSQIDLENQDFSQFPEFKKSTSFEGILSPGDMLFIPPFCWHFVKSLTCSFSVNFWWQ